MTKKEEQKIIEALKKLKNYIDKRFTVFQEELKDTFVSTLQPRHFRKLENYFVSFNEFGGVVINKENCETLFENWFDNLTTTEIIKILETYEEKIV